MAPCRCRRRRRHSSWKRSIEAQSRPRTAADVSNTTKRESSDGTGPVDHCPQRGFLSKMPCLSSESRVICYPVSREAQIHACPGTYLVYAGVNLPDHLCKLRSTATRPTFALVGQAGNARGKRDGREHEAGGNAQDAPPRRQGSLLQALGFGVFS